MKRLLAVALLSVLGLSACDNPTKPYAAKVNGVVIPESTIKRELRSVLASPQYTEAINQNLESSGSKLQPAGANTVNSTYAAQTVYNRVVAELMNQELANKHLTVTAEQLKTTKDNFRSNPNDAQLFDSLDASYTDFVVLFQTQLQVLTEARSTPEALQDYFDKHPQEFGQVCFRQIALPDETSATTFRTRVLAGEDFALLVRTQTEAGGQTFDPSIVEPDCVNRIELNDRAREILDAIPVNGVSDPIPTGQSYVLAQVTSKPSQTFEEVKESIKQKVATPSAVLADLVANADIKVNPSYGTFVKASTTSDGQSTSPSIAPYAPRLLSEKAPASSAADQTAVDPTSGSQSSPAASDTPQG